MIAPTTREDDAEHEAVRWVQGAAPSKCRNCGSAAGGRYCATCGQSTALHPPTVGEFVHEFVTHSVALEGALWRTLQALLLKPGLLTTEYFAGRRARYIAPLRLYLTFSLIVFAVSGLNDRGLTLGNQAVEFKLPQEARSDEIVIGPRVRPGQTTGIGFVDRALARIESLTPADRTARVNGGVSHYLPYVLIGLVPVLAMYLKLLYWNRRRLYGEHLVVAFHAQTAAFIFALVSAIPLGGWFGLIVLVLLAMHGWIALRRVYGGGRVATLLREAMLLTLHGITVLVALAVLATLSLALSA